MTPLLPARRYEFGDFQFEVDSRRLLRDGEVVPLPPKAAALLQLFLERRGAVLKKDEIFATLWPNEIVEESNLTRTIYLLRKTLNQHAPAEQFIETLPKIGYRFLAEAREILPTPPVEEPVAVPLPVAKILPAETAFAGSPVVTADKTGWRETALGLVYRRVQVDGEGRLLPVKPGIPRQAKLTLWAVSGLVVLGLLALTARQFFQPEIHVASIAVLPFSEIGGEARESVLGLGVADTVISRLGSLGEIEIRPTSAIRRYAERAPDPLPAGRELQVEAVLTGNIQRLGGQARLTAQLLRVRDGKTLWSVALDEDAAELFALQDHLTEEVAKALHLPLTAEQRRQLRKRDTENLTAYNLYLKGRLFWNRRSPEWIRKAIESFEAAIQADPNYALAYSGLADCYSLVVSGLPPLERMPKAKQAAQKALELDDALAEAHASLAFIKYKFDWDWRGAESEFRRAIELNPNYATAHHWYGECLGLQGRFAEAHAALKQAERLDPLSLAIKEDIGMVWFRMRDFQKALSKYKEVQELDPRFARIRNKLSELYGVMGRHDEAVAEKLAFLEMNGKQTEAVASLREAYQRDSWQGFIRKEIELVLADKISLGQDYVAKRYVILGDAEHAISWLEKSFESRGEGPIRMKTDPEFDPLRSDPRFIALLQRAGHTL
ncbi:MAG TPA: winged helix-turn-helix domain-containing protein [Blastocatellia bacterium]|nr:winged helix-turn-helix domain-containing protein [Blastocatellia bacterium]HMX29569.1 winged helix-turn-helix domain-containing protein [Blastocatellia bacterium]HMZ18210.1 winged helix-turn-helix domain-containing protein [Blastocatellia bacterium]HNG34289.1 winged helix-turn-helix domain-containing protein [Blastocatellia bacterium]